MSSHEPYNAIEDDDEDDHDHAAFTTSVSFSRIPLTSYSAPDHLLLSIIVLFLCCPFGAVAVIKSLEAQAARERGHVVDELVNASLARRWAIFGLTVGLFFNFCGLLVIMIYLFQADDEDTKPILQ